MLRYLFMLTGKKFILSFIILLVFQVAGYSQPLLKNTCNGKTEPVLLTDAINYFKIENWPGKSLMNLECTCSIEFEDAGGIFKLTPSQDKTDTLKLFKDEKLLKEFILEHRLSDDLKVYLQHNRNNTISRKYISTENELMVKTGNPGCKTNYSLTGFDVVLAGERIHCNGNKFSTGAVSKINSLKPGMQFNIENAKIERGTESILLPEVSYFLKD